jgi:hypothetical protein
MPIEVTIFNEGMNFDIRSRFVPFIAFNRDILKSKEATTI